MYTTYWLQEIWEMLYLLVQLFSLGQNSLWYMCRGQKALWELVSPSFMLILGVELDSGCQIWQQAPYQLSHLAGPVCPFYCQVYELCLRIVSMCADRGIVPHLGYYATDPIDLCNIQCLSCTFSFIPLITPKQSKFYSYENTE